MEKLTNGMPVLLVPDENSCGCKDRTDKGGADCLCSTTGLVQIIGRKFALRILFLIGLRACTRTIINWLVTVIRSNYCSYCTPAFLWAKAQAGQTAREVGEKTASGLAKAAISAFFALLVSLIAAAVGGYLAAPRDLTTRNAAAARA
jgi:hypothetical protein